MLKKYPFITGTIILTATGLISRVIGFFYRVFLSHTIGEEGMGIYQLISAIMVLSFSITAAGIQTAISKHVAVETTNHDYKSSLRFLLAGCTMALSLSVALGTFLYTNAGFLAASVLLETRCTPLIKIYSLSLPFGCLHSCINGYYYGIKKTGIPAVTQLLEQVTRVASVYIIADYYQNNNVPISISIAVTGIVIGECASMLVSSAAVYLRFSKLRLPLAFYGRKETLSAAVQLTRMAVPLTANRLIINTMQSIEAIYIPNRLLAYGMSTSQALSTYGVLTGMALPLILFPGALTNSISVLLLPYVSEADANQHHKKISAAIRKCIFYCLLMGFACLVFFLTTGRYLGTLLFNSNMAGQFIITLSFICPFLYVGSVLSSILYGLGKAGLSFIFNAVSLGIRLIFVFFTLPIVGIRGYLYGLLISQICFCALNLLTLRKYLTTGS